MEYREPERIEAKDLDGKLTALEKEIEQVFIDGWNQTKGRQCLSVREIWEKLGRSPSIGHQAITRAMERLEYIVVTEKAGDFSTSGYLLPMQTHLINDIPMEYEVFEPFRARPIEEHREEWKHFLGED